MSDNLTKLTVNLLPKSVGALVVIVDTEDCTRTDAVNRALQGWAEIVRRGSGTYRMQDGALVFLEETPDGV